MPRLPDTGMGKIKTFYFELLSLSEGLLRTFIPVVREKPDTVMENQSRTTMRLPMPHLPDPRMVKNLNINFRIVIAV